VRVLHCQPNRWIEGEVSLKRVTEACVAVSAQCVDSQSTADRLWDHMRPAALYHCSERPQAADAAISAPRYVHAWIVAASSCYRRGLRDQVGACELPLPVLRERPPPTAGRKVAGTGRCDPVPSPVPVLGYVTGRAVLVYRLLIAGGFQVPSSASGLG
jgi:hypothetical protein